ncbi:MAG: vWA domain-containing protein [Steroidobacteraceae bacterium]
MFEWLFKYPAGDFVRGQWLLTRGWPLWLALLLWLAGVLLLGALAWRRRAALGSLRVGGIVVLQAVMWALVLLLWWQPALLLRSLREGANSVALLLDVSGSMSRADPEPTRLQQARAALADPVFTQLRRSYTLQRYAFSNVLQPLGDYAQDGKGNGDQDIVGAAAAAGQTDIGGSLQMLLAQLRGKPLGAVVLFSDGADNNGALDPGQLEQIAAFGVPVHVVGIGRERMPEDLELQSVSLPARTLPGTSLNARVAIRHDGAAHTRLKVYDGEQLLAAQDVDLSDAAQVTSTSVRFDLTNTGYRRLRFVLDAGSAERELRNNERTRVVQVADDRAGILYAEGEPRWEYKFMRRALDGDASVRLATWLRMSPNGYYRQGLANPDELKSGFPTDKATLYGYSAVIIGSMPAGSLSNAQQTLLRDFVSERGGTLLMLGGSSGLGEGGWGNSILAPVLPAALPGKAGSFVRARAQAVPTARGRRTPMLQFSDDPAQNDAQWKSLPLLADYQQIGALRPAAVSLLEARVGDKSLPLLVSQPYGRGHALILATSGTWRWQMALPLADQHHELFWRQLARALVIDAPQPFELGTSLRGDTVALRAQLRDGAFVPQDNAQLIAQASNGTQSVSVPLQATVGQSGSYGADWQPPASGSWFVEVTATRAGKQLGKARAVVDYQRGAAEYFGLRQNRTLLEQLARATGGSYWRADQLAGLPEAIRASRAGVTQQQLLPLWDMPALFVLLLALKAAEWLLRRRWGVV